MKRQNKKASPIMIDGEAYDMINISKTNGELVASITPNRVVSDKGYKVELIKDAKTIRFREMD